MYNIASSSGVIGVEVVVLNSPACHSPTPSSMTAAAAVVLLGVGLWQAGGFYEDKPILVSPEQEALLYIESEQWSTEDVLSLSDDPNALLDQIIEEEYAKSAPLWTEEETWF